MRHYHGSPIGGPRAGVRRFLADRHALVPFARPDDAADALAVCRSVVLDNSAFTYWRQGGAVDVPGYFAWVESLAAAPALAWCLIPDTIDGTEADNVALVEAWQALGCSVLGVPVWHLHESLGWLDHLVRTFPTVALGSSGQWATPGTPAWWQRMAEAMAVACDDRGRPRAQLHGLRMLDPAIFTRLPLASADSTNAARNSAGANRFGTYRPKERWQRATVIAWCIEAETSPATWRCPGVQGGLEL